MLPFRVISKAMETAPDSATHLSSQELEEEWVESGVLPPEGQPTVRFDSRRVVVSDDAGIEVPGGEGAAEQGLTREWTEQMSKMLDRSSEGRDQQQKFPDVAADASGVCEPECKTMCRQSCCLCQTRF